MALAKNVIDVVLFIIIIMKHRTLNKSMRL